MNPKPLFTQFWNLIDTQDLADLGPAPRHSRLPLAELQTRADSFFGQAGTAIAIQPLLRSVALLWHDYLAESHQISKNLSSPDGNYLHAIMHRRESDYDNAKHWFYRVGRHESFLEIARKTTAWLVPHDQKKLTSRLVPNGLWDPFAFIDAVAEATAAAPEAPPRPVLQQVQFFEVQSLLEHVLR